MKITQTDNRFWKLVGDLCYSDFDVDGFQYDLSKDAFVLIAPGERIFLSRDQLNKMLESKKNFDYIKANWKTGNQFDGKIEKDS